MSGVILKDRGLVRLRRGVGARGERGRWLESAAFSRQRHQAVRLASGLLRVALHSGWTETYTPPSKSAIFQARVRLGHGLAPDSWSVVGLHGRPRPDGHSRA